MANKSIYTLSIVCCCIYALNGEKLILETGTYDDDFSGWNNDHIIFQNTQTNQTYHGLFNGTTNLSRSNIEMEVFGTLMMHFTLILSCEIRDTSDKIRVFAGSKYRDYFWTESTEGYPYTDATGFTVDEFNTEPLVTNQCSSSSSSKAWSIKAFIKSNNHRERTAVNLAFVSLFNNTHLDQENKYWAVTNITFTAKYVVVTLPKLAKSSVVATVTIVSSVCFILVIMFLVPRKVYDTCNRKKRWIDTTEMNI